MTVAVTPDREALADRLIDALHEYVDHGPVDLRTHVDALTASLRGSASEAATAAVLTAVAAIPTRYWTHLGSGVANPQAAKALTAGLFQPLREALFAALHPFDRQDDLLAAEVAVADLERAVGQAKAQLEDAVDAQDLAAVMSLRADAEVTLPGRLAAARTRLIELQIAAAQHQLDQAAAAVDRAEKRTGKARQARDEAAAELQRRASDVQAAEADQATSASTRDALRTQIARQQAQLEEHQGDHDREQRDRIRHLAGLAA